MQTISFPIPEAMLRTLKRDRCHVRRIGPYRFEVRNKRGTVYAVVLSVASSGFAYTCNRVDGSVCESAIFGNVCRHATSAAMLCMGRNEMRKRAASCKFLAGGW